LERIVNIAINHKEAEEYDFFQQASLTPEQRQEIAFEMKKRVYDGKFIDIRKSSKVVIKLKDN
jgi:hypothetical protein